MRQARRQLRSSERELRDRPLPRKRAIAMLKESGMPPDEIRLVTTSGEPDLVHRYLELHLERLEEWLTDQQANLGAVERLLATSRTPLTETAG